MDKLQQCAFTLLDYMVKAARWPAVWLRNKGIMFEEKQYKLLLSCL